MIRRVDTIILLVDSIEESVRFYKEKIGMPLKFKSPGWAEFVIGEVHIALHRRSRELNDESSQMDAASISVNLEVDNIDETLVRLANHGVYSIGEVKQYEFGRYFFVTDPDGYVIGFREYKKEYST